MKLRCRECSNVYDSKDVREQKRLTYANFCLNQEKAEMWHDCIDGCGSEVPNLELDNDPTEVIGYDGCLGWL